MQSHGGTAGECLTVKGSPVQGPLGRGRSKGVEVYADSDVIRIP